MIQYPTDPESLREWSDALLLAEYQRTTGEEQDAQAMNILDEIQRRELDI